LLGVNSVYQPQDVRQQLWDECQSYTSDIPWGDLTQAIGLEQAGEIAQHILAGVTRGRVVVKVA